MPNKPGGAEWFDYQESPGVNRRAKLTETYIVDPTETHDSDWFVKLEGESMDAPAHGPHDWITYLGTDNQIWYATTKCSIFHPTDEHIDVKFNTWHGTGQDKHDSEWIGIVDWDGTKWKVFVHEVQRPRGQPKFTLDNNF